MPSHPFEVSHPPLTLARARTSLLHSLFTPIAAILAALALACALQLPVASRLPLVIRWPILGAPSNSTSRLSPMTSISPVRTPVLFISHGGPPTLFDTKSLAHKQWTATGRTIQQTHAMLKERHSNGLKGILVISAHWESESDAIKINTAPSPLIYDFYNFPAHYYSQTFPHETLNQSGISEVGRALDVAGIKWEGVRGRGLDHGAWVPLKIAFPEAAPPPAPLLQISLPRPSSADQLERSLALGRALAPLREQGYLILASGQPVHNLRDLGKAFNSAGELDPSLWPCGGPFLKRVGQWVRDSAGEVSELEQVRRWPDYKRAVPEDDHFAPVVVALGAGSAYDGKATVELEQDQGPLGWGFYNWSS